MLTAGLASGVLFDRFGILGGALRQILELLSASCAVGDDQIPKQGGVQDERPLPCPIMLVGRFRCHRR